MVLYVGYGSRSCERCTLAVPITPAPPCWKKGFATDCVSAAPCDSRLGSSAFMLMLAVVVVRCVDLDPTKPISLAIPPGSSRWMSKEYCCTYGDFAVGSTMLKLWPMPVRLPRLLPTGCR